MGGHFKHVVTVQPKSDDFIQSTSPGSDGIFSKQKKIVKFKKCEINFY